MRLTVPADKEYDMWGENNALRITQNVDDQDFAVEAVFTSIPDSEGQSQGIVIQDTADSWLRFDTHHTGSELRLFAAETKDGETSTLLQQEIPVSSQVGLRVTRMANHWMLDYSHDGILWTYAGSVEHQMNVTEIGLFASNGEAGSEFTAEATGFINLPKAYREPEPASAHRLTTSVIGKGYIDQQPYRSDGYPAGAEIVVTANALPGWEFANWGGDVTGDNPTIVLPIDDHVEVEATFTQQPIGPPVIDVWHGDDQTFGQNGRSQRWVNILGRATDDNGIDFVTYALNEQRSVNLALGPDNRRLSAEGDFNIQIPYDDLHQGTNSVTLTAVDNVGESTTETITVRKDVQAIDLPHAVEWNDVDDVTDVAQTVDGRWASDDDGVTIREAGYDRAIAIGHSEWTDYEVTVPVTVRGITTDQITPESGMPAVGIGMHWTGHSTRIDEEPAVDWFPTGAFAWHRWQSGGRFELEGNEGAPYVREDSSWEFDTTYMMKMRAESVAEGVQYTYKWWPDWSAEPEAWDLTVIEDDGPTEGSILLVAHHVDATFGDIVITPS
ncbi:InlB B-repeat-containing protein [Phytoactinopolyspora endophytica]|uniref:InlB B-repeat-containing protein n=1 Tax=Phytoactinopolyspora endophytica TaxID=1642495 RepID=UPI00101CCE75|nr:hypothetical protein [Phytoactinopolyspora endophytica]